MDDVPSSPRFRRLLISAIAVPLGLMLLLSGAMWWQITSLLKESSDVEQSDEILAETHQLLGATVDMETGVRAFMVTHEETFLEPYKNGLKMVDSQSALLQGLTAGHPRENDLLAQIVDARRKWQQFAEGEIASKRADPGFMSIASEREGKKQMDQIRNLFTQLIQRETQVRMDESEQAHNAARFTLALVAGIALGGGAVLAVLSRRQLRAISETYREALESTNRLNIELELRVAHRTAELEKRSSELAEANKELEAFAYSVSHDLRAPMRHIAGFSDLIRGSSQSNLSVDDRENLETIHNTARLAGRMVDDLLSFSRVGRATLRPTAVDLNGIVAECRKELNPDTAGRKIEWSIGPLPSVTADRAMLKMAVQNLLSNAVKYTSTRTEAKIEIGTTDTPPPADAVQVPQNRVGFFVRDNGVGFDMAYARKLFGVFQRLHRAEEFEGTGIGLANVRRIVIRGGGWVWATGETGRGATFFVVLPVAQAGPVREPTA
jgi:signal transduction histidine kinase